MDKKALKEVLTPIGAAATAELRKCAENWTDSEVAILRARLPLEYHALPCDFLRKEWVNIRKRGTDGYHTNGKGPEKGSRKKVNRQKPPAWYLKYLDSDDWKERRVRWLEFWNYRCAACNASRDRDEVILDIHHRTYERIGKEELIDCIVLCRRCHDLFEDTVKQDDRTLF